MRESLLAADFLKTAESRPKPYARMHDADDWIDARLSRLAFCIHCYQSCNYFDHPTCRVRYVGLKRSHRPRLTVFQQIVSHYTRLLARWPKDVLRPEKTFQQLVLEPRLQAAPSAAPAGVTSEAITSGASTNYTRNENNEVNAAYLLLENSFSKQFPPGQRVMEPASNPEHYKNLERELQELPNRSVFGNFVQRLKSMVRFK